MVTYTVQGILALHVEYIAFPNYIENKQVKDNYIVEPLGHVFF